MATPTAIVAYLALFAAIGALFLLVNLLVGKLVRPTLPNEEKLEIYECGEPVIGSSFVQFDLRFYVVALLFIIFDVEIAFFFPWATVFGKATQLSSPQVAVATAEVEGTVEATSLAQAAQMRLEELGLNSQQIAQQAAESDAAATLNETAQQLALTSIYDIGVFFAVLLVGFAYVWRRGDLDWVRAITSQQDEVVERVPSGRNVEPPKPTGSILSA